MARVVIVAAAIIVGLFLGAAKAQEQTNGTPDILIVEIQTGSAESSSQEFVELYNRSHKLIDTEDMELKLQYKSSSGTSWLTKASLGGELQPRGRYLIATAGYIENTSHESGLGLAAGGGHLRVISDGDDEIEYDTVAWGSAESALMEPANAPEPGQSLKRLVDEDGHFIDTDNDKADFITSDTPSPASSKPPPKLNNEEEFEPSRGNFDGADLGRSSSGEGGASGRPSANLKISELFIDPDKPLTDADDEFVEIFNPTDDAVDLEDYVLKTGSSFRYSFTLPNISIESGQYLALFSIDTGLVLSNSGGTARLIGPDGKTVYEVPAYSNAKTDTAWADIDGTWRWTDSPTPNAPNGASGSDGGGQDSLSANGNVMAANASAGTDGRTVYEEPPQSSSEANTAVVAGVGSMALLYVGYEYRYDIGNRIHQLRRYLASRRGGGEEA